jgi:hypothetical protein
MGDAAAAILRGAAESAAHLRMTVVGYRSWEF